MRVLHVIDALGVGGGAEHSLAFMLPLLRDRGVRSSVVCLYPRAGGLHERLREQGFKVELVPAGTLAGKAVQLRRKIRDTTPDVVHATLLNSCFVTRMACLGTGTSQVNSLVNTTYDPLRVAALGISPWKIRALQAVDRLTAMTVEGGFHALTDVVRQEATEVLRIPDDRIWVIPRGRSSSNLGVSTVERRNATRKRLQLAPDDLVVLNVGRQDLQKAQALLVDSFGLVAAEIPNAILVVAGRDGDGTEALLQSLEHSSVRKRIRLLGHRTDVADLLVASDLFVFPSVYEGLGGALLEAMALRCPIVGSDAPAIREVLRDGEYGRVVRRGDVPGLAEALTTLLREPKERALLAEKARCHFDDNYELDRIVDRTVDMYNSVISGARTA